MPSTREGSPAPPGSKGDGSSFDDGVNIEQLRYALPRGMLSSANSVAVTSASPSENGDVFSTPARGSRAHHFNGHFNENYHDFAPTPSTVHGSEQTASIDPLEKLAQDLESGYQVQQNLRLQKFLVQFPGGVPDFEADRFKQKEAIERTKFVCYKDAQIAKAINIANPYVSAPATAHRPASDFAAFAQAQAHPHHPPALHNAPPVHNPFKVNSSFPPPPSTRDRSVNGTTYGSAASYGSYAMSSSNSGMPESTHSGTEASSSALPNGNDATAAPVTEAEQGFTRDQIVSAFEVTWKKIDAVSGEAAQLQNEVTELKQLLVALTSGSDLNSMINRITALEHKLRTIENGGPLESDAAFVANLEREVKMLDEKVAKVAGDSVTRRSFQAENELTKMTFNNKCSLIERYLGIDITTTGPKPHDVLEALHHRIWNLEKYLEPEDANCKRDQMYYSLNDYMAVKIDKSNAVVNYSGPGYNSNHSDTSSVYGGGAAHAMNGNFNSSFGNMSLGHASGGAAPSAFSAAPGAGRRLSNMHGHLAHMRFDPNDIRHPNNIKQQHANKDRPMSPEGGAVQPSPTQADLPRRMSATNLIPSGLVGPDYVKRNRRGTSSRASFGITSPKRKSFGHHSRANSTTTEVKDATDGASFDAPPPVPAVPQQTQPKTNDKAYRGWLNQRPGEFLGKKLAGLGQKE